MPLWLARDKRKMSCSGRKYNQEIGRNNSPELLGGKHFTVPRGRFLANFV
jgi:hypothetical protein